MRLPGRVNGVMPGAIAFPGVVAPSVPSTVATSTFGMSDSATPAAAGMILKTSPPWSQMYSSPLESSPKLVMVAIESVPGGSSSAVRLAIPVRTLLTNFPLQMIAVQ